MVSLMGQVVREQGAPGRGCLPATRSRQNAVLGLPAQPELAAGAHEHAFERFVMLDDMTGAEDHCFKWHVRHSHRNLGFPFDPLGKPTQQTATTDEIHATHQEVL